MRRGRRGAAAGLVLALVALLLVGLGTLAGAWRTLRERWSPPAATRVGWATLPPGDTSYVFGPKQENGTTAGATYVERFTAPALPGQLYTLRIVNGTANGTNRVSRVLAFLNGSQVVGLTDLTSSTAQVTKVVAVTAVDTLRLTVTGPSGSFINASVFSTPDPNYNLYGPNSFTITSGTSATYNTTFNRPSTAASPYRLYVVNGAADGTKRVSSFTVTVTSPGNSASVSGAGVGSIVQTVPLGVGTNNVAVQLSGPTQSFVTIRVTASDTAKPVVTITAPAANAVIGSSPVTVSGTISDQTPTSVAVNGVAATVTGNTSYSASVPLSTQGGNTLTVVATDAAAQNSTVTRSVVFDNQAPTLTVTAPVNNTATRNASVTVSGTVSDATTVTVNSNGTPLTVAGNGSFTGSVPLALGANVITTTATDAASNATSVVRNVTRDTLPPTLTVSAPVDGATTSADSITVSGTVSDQTAVTVAANGVNLPVSSGNFSGKVALATGPNTISVVATDAATNSTTVNRNVTRQSSQPLPPDPSTVATPIDRSVPTTVAGSTSFLYTGPNPIQTGVAPGTIVLQRAGVVRGTVVNRSGAALSGVTVSIVGHPEFGQTLSRADGMFDLAVNGGGALTVRYAKSGFLDVQREVQADWQSYAVVDSVAMTPLDPQVTLIDFTTDAQVARASVVSDDAGSRQATLIFEQGTSDTLVFANGTKQAAGALHVRATEFTVGNIGPAAMPGTLPPTSAYTYAAELSADEAIAAGAIEVQFNKPVAFYLDNFLGIPVGTHVPVGVYDRQVGKWTAEPDGRVVKVLGVTGGAADLDVSGSGQAASQAALDSLGINLPERQRLATTYSVGKTLWRSEHTHFSPRDWNFGWFPPDKAFIPQADVQAGDDSPQPNCTRHRSIISCEGQRLGEELAVTGTSFALHYESDLARGNTIGRVVTIPKQTRVDTSALTASRPLRRNEFPSHVVSVFYLLEVAGRAIEVRPALGSTIAATKVVWDGTDAYGRPVNGRQKATLSIGFAYTAVYTTGFFGGTGAGGGFGTGGGTITAVPARRQFEFTQVWHGELGSWDGRGQGLGGWTLDAQHSYDPVGALLLKGNGERVPARVLGNTITRIAGTLTNVVAFNGDGIPATSANVGFTQRVAVGPDGSVYFADEGLERIRKIDPSGIITTVAGDGTSGTGGDGGPATSAQFVSPRSLALGPDGSIYVGDENVNRVRRIAPNGIITTVAGTGVAGYSGDGGPATSAKISAPKDVAVAADGVLYIVDAGNHSVRRVGLDGVITTFAGTGVGNLSPDGGPANQAALLNPEGIAVGPDGTVYLTDFRAQIRKVGVDGIIRHVTGRVFNGSGGGFGGDGGPASSPAAEVQQPKGLAVGPDGSLYIADAVNNRVRRIGPDGMINTVVGNGQIACDGINCPDPGNGGLATQAALYHIGGVAVGPDGSLYLADFRQIRKVGVALPGLAPSDVVIASSDGAELYQFDPNGKHRLTLNPLTGDTLLAFAYTGAGALASVTDADGNVTTVERNGQGKPTAVVGQFGQRTAFTLDTAGYLASVANPKGEVVTLNHSPLGLLDSLADPRGKVHRFQYDQFGRLRHDGDPAGGSEDLALTESDTAYTVDATTGLGRTTSYRIDRLPTGATRRLITPPSGLATSQLIGLDGTTAVTTPDGTLSTVVEQSDPRFGVQAATLKSLTVRLPSALTWSVSATRTATLANAADPLSLTTQLDSLRVNGQVFTTQYDAMTRRYTSTTPEGRQTISRTDRVGRIVSDRTVGLDSVSYRYDSQGRLDQVKSGGRTWGYSHDAKGRLLSTLDPIGRRDSLFYDTADRLTRRVLPGGREVLFSYDSSGNVTSVTPPGRTAHGFGYTAVDLTSGYTPPNVGLITPATSYQYNADRQLTRITRPDSVAIMFGYDVAGRPGTVDFDRGQLTFGYSPTTAQLSSITAPGGNTLAYTYDGALPKTVTWGGVVQGSVEVGYNSDFRVTGMTVNGSDNVAFGYDRDGLLTAAGALGIKRHAQHGLTERDSVGTVKSAWSYTSRAALAGYTATNGGSTLFQTAYTRDSLDRITGLTETIGGTTTTAAFSYDSAGRLATVTRDGTLSATYEYDQNGNRTRLTTPGGVVTGTYDAQDRLTQYSTASYTYGSNGELKTKTEPGVGTSSYTYDALGNLTAVTLLDGTAITYVIDGQNRRVGKRVNGTLTQAFLYQGQLSPVAELDGSNQVVSRFVYGTRANVPDYLIKGGTTYRVIADHLGSVRLVVKASDGTVAQRIDYDEFGRVTQNTSPGFQPFGFAGGLVDEQTGLIRFGARDYDPMTGRWTAKDPLGFSAGDGGLYVYARSDPVNLIDRSGKNPLIVIGAVVGAVSGITGAIAQGGTATDIIVAGATGALTGALAGAFPGVFAAPLVSAVAGALGDLAGQVTTAELKLRRLRKEATGPVCLLPIKINVGSVIGAGFGGAFGALGGELFSLAPGFEAASPVIQAASVGLASLGAGIDGLAGSYLGQLLPD